jgi:hypothetical protein
MCEGQCSDTVGIEPKACLLNSGYPEMLWANLDNKDLSYTERVCCAENSPEPASATKSCVTSSAGMSVIVLFIFCCFLFICYGLVYNLK